MKIIWIAVEVQGQKVGLKVKQKYMGDTMKKILTGLSIMFLIFGCASNVFNKKSEHDLIKPTDSLINGKQLLRGKNQIDKCIQSNLVFPVDEILRQTNLDDIIQVYALIDERGHYKQAWIEEPQNLGVEHLILPRLETAVYESAENIENVSGEYLLEILIPVYNIKIDSAELLKWSSSSHKGREFDSPPAPNGGYATLQKNAVYPENARMQGLEGTVVIGFFVDSKGQIGDFKVLESQSYEMNRSAINAIRATRWSPALLNGANIPADLSAPVVFRLR